MSEGKHTPGPWRTEEWACHAPTTIMAGEKTVIAECSGNGEYTDETCLANARLITAAPEMPHQCDDPDCHGGKLYQQQCRELLELARVKEINAEMLEALEAIVAITDRKHDAWDKAHAATKQAMGGGHVAGGVTEQELRDAIKNGFLIAAAPDLLEALSRLLPSLKNWLADVQADAPDGWQGLANEIGLAEAAIRARNSRVVELSTGAG